MDLFGKSTEKKPGIEVQGDKLYVNGEHKAFVVHDEAVGLVYVGMNLETEDAPYGCAESLEAAISEFVKATGAAGQK